MEFKTQVLIDAPKEKVWSIISDIEGSKENITAIQKIEVHERPRQGLVGFRWTETRTMFGKAATETMWVTDAVENEYYQTRAESHGAIYISKLMLGEKDNGTELTMSFKGTPQTVIAKIMSALLSPMFKKATQKALDQDLKDIKVAAEQQ